MGEAGFELLPGEHAIVPVMFPGHDGARLATQIADRMLAELPDAEIDAALDALAPKPVLEFGRTDYGSQLRDAAALVSLASEGNAPRATLTQAVSRVETARGLTPYTSTQENAWLVLAARAHPRRPAHRPDPAPGSEPGGGGQRLGRSCSTPAPRRVRVSLARDGGGLGCVPDHR